MSLFFPRGMGDCRLLLEDEDNRGSGNRMARERNIGESENMFLSKFEEKEKRERRELEDTDKSRCARVHMACNMH